MKFNLFFPDNGIGLLCLGVQFKGPNKALLISWELWFRMYLAKSTAYM